MPNNLGGLAGDVNREKTQECRVATPYLAIKRHDPLVLLARHCLIDSHREGPVAPNDEQSTDVAERHLA